MNWAGTLRGMVKGAFAASKAKKKAKKKEEVEGMSKQFNTQRRSLSKDDQAEIDRMLGITKKGKK